VTNGCSVHAICALGVPPTPPRNRLMPTSIPQRLPTMAGLR
jgi:hypothetical protein